MKGKVMTFTSRFKLGTRVTKLQGSSWTGRVVGFYSTDYTPEGIVVESENEPGSCQLYPAHFFKHVKKEK